VEAADETNFSTEYSQDEEQAWVSPPDEHEGWQTCAQEASRQGEVKINTLVRLRRRQDNVHEKLSFSRDLSSDEKE
jgi:hypothetical protein